MSRLSRIVVPDVPRYVTQRGKRRQVLFTRQGDYAFIAIFWRSDAGPMESRA